MSLGNRNSAPVQSVRSELLVVKEQNKDLIRLTSPAVVCLQEAVFWWSVVGDVLCAGGLVVS